MKQTIEQDVTSEFYRDVVNGLNKEQKSIPSKYFYDERGSELFEDICSLKEYYPTRTELTILDSHIGEITETIGKNSLLIEFGSGSSLKTRLLLKALNHLHAYVPVDISGEFLLNEAEKLNKEFPAIDILPVEADYTLPFELPVNGNADKRVIFFPGSTIGNFKPQQAKEFLTDKAKLLKEEGGLLIGVDAKKSGEILERAYDDSEGITAEFNLNLLKRINRELGADFNTDLFTHKALYNKSEGRVEMHLISQIDQTITIGAHTFLMSAGESIHTENSYKYSPEEFISLLSERYTFKKRWTDKKQWFNIFYFELNH